MTIQNDFLAVATTGTPNVATQADYSASPAAASGYVTGLLPSAMLNKSLRQSSLMARMVAQFINNLSGQNTIDDGTTATLLANFMTSISNQVFIVYSGNPNGHVAGLQGVVGVNAPSVVWDITNRIFWVCTTTGNAAGAVWLASASSNGVQFAGTSTGSANAQVLTPTIPLPAYGAGVALAFIAGFTNNLALTVNVSGLGARNVYKEGPTGPIPCTGGEVVAGNMITIRDDGTRFQLTATELGTAALANASSNTGIVAAVSGSITAGHIPVFGDNIGTLVDGGPPGVAPAPTILTQAANNGATLGAGVYNADTRAASGGAFNILLPASPAHGTCLIFNDVFLNWGILAFTVTRNGHTIKGSAADLLCNLTGALNVELTYNSTTNDWEMA